MGTSLGTLYLGFILGPSRETVQDHPGDQFRTIPWRPVQDHLMGTSLGPSWGGGEHILLRNTYL